MAADEAGRRALLDGEVRGRAAAGRRRLPDRTDGRSRPPSGSPRRPTICRALVTLDDLAARPGLEPIRDVLSANPGAPLDGFERILFKGGSEPGVLFAAWLATRPDGARIVVTGGLVDEAAPIDPLAPQLLALGLTLS